MARQISAPTFRWTETSETCVISTARLADSNFSNLVVAQKHGLQVLSTSPGRCQCRPGTKSHHQAKHNRANKNHGFAAQDTVATVAAASQDSLILARARSHSNRSPCGLLGDYPISLVWTVWKKHVNSKKGRKSMGNVGTSKSIYHAPCWYFTQPGSLRCFDRCASDCPDQLEGQ